MWLNDEGLHEIHQLICSPIYFTPVPQTPFDRHLIASKDFTSFKPRFLWVQENDFFLTSADLGWIPGAVDGEAGAENCDVICAV